MDISRKPSPNFDDRSLPITALILHYTGMESAQAAIERLCDPEAKVSAHYVVDEVGQITQLVDEDKRAWHAGLSEWRGETDMNSASIGIEIVNGGHNFPNDDGSLPEFPDAQIKTVTELSSEIIKRHGISPGNVIGHSDVAPARKQDPGEHFPWSLLALSGVSQWPEDISEDRRVLFEDGSRDRGVSIVQSGLSHIGYGVTVTGVLDKDTRLVLAALQRRYRPDQIDGQVDVQTMEIIKWLAENRG